MPQKPFKTLPLYLGCAMLSAGYACAEEDKAIEHVTVTGTQTSSLEQETMSGSLGSRSVLDTPFSVSVITSENIADKQVNSIERLFSLEASVLTTGGNYSNFGSVINVRGLPLSYTDSFKINGRPVNNFSGELPYEAFEQIELLKGLSGFMYGFGTPGGIVNYVTKKPTDEDLLSFGVGLRSKSILTEQVDIGGRKGKFGYRINLAHEDGDTVNDNDDYTNDGAEGAIERDTFAGSFDVKITDQLTWVTDLIYNKRRVDESASWINYFALTEGDELPEPVNGSRNPAAKGTFEEGETKFVNTGLRWEITKNWLAKMDYSESENNTRWAKSLLQLRDTEGELRVRIYDQAFDTDFDSSQLMVEGKFQSGTISHQLVTGLSTQKMTAYRSDDTRIVTWLPGFDNLYEPVPLSYESTFEEQMEKAYYAKQHAFFISDTLGFNAQWSLLMGLRYTDYESSDNRNNWKHYNDQVTTPTVALMFKPETGTTFYASYVESLEEGSVVSETMSYTNGGEMLPPLESEQMEIGFKKETADWTATAAIFHIERAAEYANASMEYVQDGKVIFDGIELAAGVQITDDLLFSTSITALQTEYENTQADLEGNDVEGVPELQAAVEAAYTIPAVDGLTISAGAKHTGKTTLDQNNYWELDSYTLYDLNANYTTQVADHALTIRGTINNVTDEEYWATDGSGSMRIGEPRSFAISAQLDW